jgi:tetratricopeptide (TPR) repeat protein
MRAVPNGVFIFAIGALSAFVLPAASQTTPPASCANIHCPNGRTVACPSAHPSDAQVRAACGMGGAGISAPAGPTAEELRAAHEAKDSREAADDANDKGVDAYKAGDWDKAIALFKEGLEYEPDDPDLKTNLERAEAKKRLALSSTAAKEAVSANVSGTNAAGMSGSAASAEARRTFDSPGTNAGGINVEPVVIGGSSVHADPVVSAEKRTPTITKYEEQRTALRKENTALDEKLKALDPQKDAVAISKVKQEKSDLDNKVNFLNFSISEELKKPAETAGPGKTN